MRSVRLLSMLFSTSLLASSGMEAPPLQQGSMLPAPYYYGPDFTDFYTEGDLLVWQPYTQDALAWVDLRHIDINPESHSRYHDVLQRLHYGWDPSFRVATGYRLKEDAISSDVRPWQFEINYTQLIANAYDSVPAQTGVYGTNFIVAPLVPMLIFQSGSDADISGSSVLNLSYRHTKAQFAFPIWIAPNVIWRLIGGASYAWFHNVWNSVYSTVPIESTLVGDRGDTYTDLSWKFAGGGLLAATDFHMEVGKGLGFFAKGALDVLTGRVSLTEHYRQLAQIDATGGPQPILHQDKNYYRTFTRFQPAVTFGAGLDYKHWFIPKRLMAYLSVGYEWMLWFNLDQFGRVNQRWDTTTCPMVGILATTPGNFFDTEPSDLGFHGVTTQFGLEF